MNVITHNILVDLDCLLDTRLSTYHLIDSTLPSKLLDNGYYTRMSDEMPKVISKEVRKEYLYRYKNRADNPKTLAYALPTNMYKYLVDFYHGYTADQIVALSKDRSICSINIYPYILTDEQREMVKRLLLTDLFAYCDIDIVNIDVTKVDIENMVRNYNEYVTYESNAFLNHWFVDFNGFISPAFKVTLPKLAIGDKELIGLKEDEELSREKLYEGMESMRTSCSGIFYLGFLPPQFYSPRKR